MVRGGGVAWSGRRMKMLPPHYAIRKDSFCFEILNEY